MLGALSRLRSWELDRREQDIRGWPLRDAQGNTLGTVHELIVDTSSQHVIEVVLRDGRRLAAHDVVIGDRTLVLAPSAMRETPAREAPQPVLRATAPQAPRAGGAAKPSERAADPQPVVEHVASESKPDEMLDGDLLVSLVDEELEIGKRPLYTGGVRVKTRVVSRPFDKEVRLREEHVTVERRRVNQPLPADQAEALLHDRSIAAAATREAPVVQKQVRVVEEILVKKETGERIAQIHETLRHTEVDVVELPDSIRAEAKKGN